MRCPHLPSGVCDACRSRYDAVDRLAERLEREATVLHPQVELPAEDHHWQDGTRLRGARAHQPFGLHAHERVGLVVTTCVVLLLVVTSLPAWARLLLVLTAMAVLFHTRGRPVDALLDVTRGFVRGGSTRTG